MSLILGTGEVDLDIAMRGYSTPNDYYGYNYDYYDSYDQSAPSREILWFKVVLGVVLVVVNLTSLLGVSVFCGKPGEEKNSFIESVLKYPRDIFSTVKNYLNIAMTIGIVGLVAFIVSFIPFPITSMIARVITMVIPIDFAIMAVIVGHFGGPYIGDTLSVLKKNACDATKKDKAIMTTGALTLGGIALVGLGVYGKEPDE
jgi:hypothetical protein